MQNETTLLTQHDPFYVPVVIVGAGPTGLTAGNLLGMAGIETLILERNMALSDCPKAISIDDEGLRACQAMGLSHEVIKDVLLDIDAQYVSQGHLLATVAPTGLRNGHPLISTLHQPTFEATLLRGLERFRCVQIRFQHTITAFEQNQDQVLLHVQRPDGTSLQLACTYLLACDGGRSSIRHALGIPMLHAALKWHTYLPGTRSQWHSRNQQVQRWLVVDCINDHQPSTLATFFCNSGRQAVTVPAPHHHRRWEFLLQPGEHAEEMLRLDTIQHLIKQATNSLPTSNTSFDTKEHAAPQIIRQTIYTFRNAIAARFQSGRVFLLGDAAHLMPPFGGQGMNSGLRDALNLCWKIRLIAQGLASPTLLETYHQERYPHVARMIRFSSMLGTLIMSSSRSLTIARDLFFRTLNTIPPARRMLREAHIKPQPRYYQGLLLPTRQRRTLTGTLLPQPYVTTLTGKLLLLDEVLGNNFALLRLSSTEYGPHTFSLLAHTIWTHLKVRFISIYPSHHDLERAHHDQLAAPENDRHTSIIDGDGHLARFLHHNPSLFVLVRPDRYILGTFTRKHADRFAHALLHILHPTHTT